MNLSECLRVNQPMPHRELVKRNQILAPGFSHDVLAVRFDCAFADEQLLGHLVVAVFLDNKFQDFDFALGKVCA